MSANAAWYKNNHDYLCKMEVGVSPDLKAMYMIMKFQKLKVTYQYFEWVVFMQAAVCLKIHISQTTPRNYAQMEVLFQVGKRGLRRVAGRSDGQTKMNNNLKRNEYIDK